MSDHGNISLPASSPLLGHAMNDNAQSTNVTATGSASSVSGSGSRKKIPRKPVSKPVAAQDFKGPGVGSTIKLWRMELFSIVFSLCCSAANVGVLTTLDDKPYQSWRVARVDIAPNRIISTIATFTKASLLLTVAEVIVQLKWLYFEARMQRVSDMQIFDDASRGPLGSMRLLWSINLHVRWYPTIALKATNVTASIGTTNDLSPVGEYSGDLTDVAPSTYLQQLNIAANSAILNPAADPVYDCPTGSCTWPHFSSLALCNSCENLGPHIDVNCTSTREMGDGYRLCTYSVGWEIVGLVQGTEQPLVTWNLWQKAGNGTWQPNTLMNITQDFTDAFAIPGMSTWLNIVHFDEPYTNTGSDAPDNVMPNLLRCELNWCARYYGSTDLHNGTLSDVPDFSVPLAIESSSTSYVPDTNATHRSLAELRSFSKTDELYTISRRFSKQYHDLLMSVLESTAFSTTTESSPIDQLEAIDSLHQSYYNEYWTAMNLGTSLGKDYSLYYSNGGNISKTLDNIATGVTNQMRSGFGSRNVAGDVYYPTVYIHVVWPWFIYPAVLSVSAAVLLGLTMWLSHGRDKMIWKSSSLALLFHGLPYAQIDGRLLRVDEMDEAADDMWVKLSKNESGGVGLKTF